MDTYTQRQQLSGDDVPESNSNPHCINSTGPDEPQPQVALNYQNSLRRDLDRIDSSNVVPNPDEPPQTIHPRLLSDKSKRWVAFKTRFMKEMQRLREEKARQEALARRRPPKIPESYAEAVAIMPEEDFEFSIPTGPHPTVEPGTADSGPEVITDWELLKKQREIKPLSELISPVSEGSKSTKSTQTQMGSDVAGSEDWELLSSSDSGNVKRKQPETIPNTPYDEPTETDPTEPHITHKKARTVACKHNIHPSPMIQFGDAPWVGPYPSLSTTVEATSVENNTEVGPIDFGENPSLRLSYPKGEATENDESPLPEETAKARTTNPYGILFGGFE